MSKKRKPAPPAQPRRKPELEALITHEYLVKAAVAKFGYPVGDGLGVVLPVIDPTAETVLSVEQISPEYLVVRLDPPKAASPEDKVAALEARVAELQLLLERQGQMAAIAETDPDQAELDEMVQRGRVS